ncbi:MAG: hydroxymethylglutaryl-CoA reductase, degradative [Myxococcota bacterium]
MATSRIPGFYKRPLEDRTQEAADRTTTPEAREYFESGGGLPLPVADRMSENVVTTFGLPMGLGLNFRINGRDVLVPMVVEEPSVIAAASNAARLVRVSGGFSGKASDPVMTGQVQLDQVEDLDRAQERLAQAHGAIVDAVHQAIPRMVARGGGLRDIELRVLSREEGFVVVHLYVNVGEAMGANIVDRVAEHAAPAIERALGGRVGLRILSNLPLRRTVSVQAEVSADALDAGLADGIARASRFAELDPFRAVTHNKGILNGIDATAVAFGQDWRAIEAAAHGFAAIGDKGYRPLAVWRRTQKGLLGTLRMPLAVGVVGGSTKVHPGVRAAFELSGIESSAELAVVIGAAGLASNLAALRALAGEGIQKGHMKLHERKAVAARERAPTQERSAQELSPAQELSQAPEISQRYKGGAE